MSLPVKSYFLFIMTCIFLTACGFEPMYGNTTAGSYGNVSNENKLANIYIASIPDVEGQFLRNELIDRFYRRGRPANPIYTLQVDKLKETEINLDVTIESENTRAQLKISTTMTLIDQQSGEVLLTRHLRAFNSFNVLGSQFTTIVSEQDAREATLNDLARQIETQLLLHFERK